MDAYHALAASYDRLTDDVDYGAVVDFYREILNKEGVQPRTAVDLACGTGSVALLLALGMAKSLCGTYQNRQISMGARPPVCCFDGQPGLQKSLKRLLTIRKHLL